MGRCVAVMAGAVTAVMLGACAAGSTGGSKPAAGVSAGAGSSARPVNTAVAKLAADANGSFDCAALLPAAALTQATGTTKFRLQPPPQKNRDGETNCAFGTTPDTSGSIIDVSVRTNKAIFATKGDVFNGMPNTPVAGFDGDATYAFGTAYGEQVAVLDVTGQCLQVDVLIMPDDAGKFAVADPKAAAVALARTIVDHISC